VLSRVRSYERFSSANSLQSDSTNEQFTAPSSGVLAAAEACPTNCNSKSDILSHAAESSAKAVSESDLRAKYPKTKKQKAVDGRVTGLTTFDGRISDSGALTFGEIQERLITRVVESGALVDAICDERQLMTDVGQHNATDQLPLGWILNSETAQNRPCLAVALTSLERQKVGDVSVTSVPALLPAKQPSVPLATRGLWILSK